MRWRNQKRLLTLRLARISGGMTVSVIAEAAIYSGDRSAAVSRRNYKIIYRSNHGGFYSVLGSLPRKCFRKGNEPHFGRAVICLAEIACRDIHLYNS